MVAVVNIIELEVRMLDTAGANNFVFASCAWAERWSYGLDRPVSAPLEQRLIVLPATAGMIANGIHTVM